MSGLTLFWQSRTRREQYALLAAGVAVIGWLCWVLIVAPAITHRKQVLQQLPALRAQSAYLLALVREAGTASSSAPGAMTATTTKPWSQQTLEYALAEAGLQAQQITVTQSLIALHFSDQSFTSLIEWLQQAQREQHWFVSEATITAREHPDRIDARLSLQP